MGMWCLNIEVVDFHLALDSALKKEQNNKPLNLFNKDGMYFPIQACLATELSEQE